MNLVSYGPAFAGGLFVGMLVLLEAGYRIGQRRYAKHPESEVAGIGAVNGAVFGLLGLLVAFTFSGAASRFDARQQLVVQEANAIGTAWLRVDLLPQDQQGGMRDLFRRYMDSRLETYRLLPDLKAAEAKLAESLEIQGMMWQHAVAACQKTSDPSVKTLVLAAMNDMFDSTQVRTEAGYIHPPTVIFGLLFGLALGCSLLAGFGMSGSKARNKVHVFGFAGILALSVYVIMELEYPRVGVIKVDQADHLLTKLRADMD